MKIVKYLKKAISILLLIVLVGLAFNVNKSVAVSKIEVGEAIAEFAKNFCAKHGNRVIWYSVDVMDPESYGLRGEAYQEEIVGSMPTYYLDAAGWVSYVIHHATGLENEGARQGNSSFIFSIGTTDDNFENVTNTVRNDVSKLQPGDILVNSHHMLIYVGDGNVIDSRGTGLTYTTLEFYGNVNYLEATYGPGRRGVYDAVFRISDEALEVINEDNNGAGITTEVPSPPPGIPEGGSTGPTEGGDGEDGDYEGGIVDGNPGDDWIFEGDGYGELCTSTHEDSPIYCMEHGRALKDNTLADGLEQGDIYEENGNTLFCDYDVDKDWRPSANKDGVTAKAYTTEMTVPTSIDPRVVQDIAYALTQVSGVKTPANEVVQYVVWHSDISMGKDAVSNDSLFKQAQAYKEFYETIHAMKDDGTEVGFQAEDTTDYENIRTLVDQDEGVYILGTYNIDYSSAIYTDEQGTVKFGYIDEMVAYDQNGNTDGIEIVDILDTDGNSIKARPDYQFPNSGEDFWIKIKLTNPGVNITDISFNYKFKYLSYCETGPLFHWVGNIYEWGYVKKFTGEPHVVACEEIEDESDSYWDGYDDGYYDGQSARRSGRYYGYGYYDTNGRDPDYDDGYDDGYYDGYYGSYSYRASSTERTEKPIEEDDGVDEQVNEDENYGVDEQANEDENYDVDEQANNDEDGSHNYDGYFNEDGYTHDNCHSNGAYHYEAYYYQLEKAYYTAAQDMLEVTPIGGKFAIPHWEEIWLYEEGEEKIKVDITMELGGMVFLDRPADKNTDLLNVNGLYDEGFDLTLADIEVTLYEEDGTLATLIPEVDEEGNEITPKKTNPTLTDANGQYSFGRLDAQKKYYVTFKISGKYMLDGTEFLANGQHLESTMYTANIDNYNTEEWARSSMASILDVDREEFNNRFATIDSAPNNYKIVNKIFNDIGDYNKTYNIFDQTYEGGQSETDELKYLQGQIIEKIRNYINTNQKYPDGLAKSAIYGEVASENSGINEVKNKIQYLVDIEVIATTGHHSEIKCYPVYNQFIIDKQERDESITLGTKEFKPIYPGKKHINLGVIEREKFDLKLTKDIFEIKVIINGKEHVYKCNRREDEPNKIEIELNGEMVELDERGSDVLFESQDGVHNAYERDLRESDIQFIDYITNRNQEDRRLRVFVTYKIRVTNQSNGNITGNVTKIRDYYDSDYLFEFDYADKKDSYISKPDGNTSNINWNATGQGNTLETTDVGVALKAGEFFDIFTEYEVTTDALKRILSDESSTKENYAEIMGYSTTYTDQRTFNDGDVINSAGDVAGLVDRDSRPGDFEVTDEVRDFVQYSYTDDFKSKDGETKTKESLAIFQDDADKAPGLNLKLLSTLRELKGNVWEDKIVRETLEQNNIRIGNGQNDDDQPIAELKVELIDINNITGSPDETTSSEVYGQCNIADIYNDGSFKSAITLTDANGNYYFSGYVPGDYLVRFIYGERELLVTNANGGKVYNAQDYKSTLYNDGDYGIADGYYWYEETKELKTSDAVDNFARRNEINSEIANQDMTYNLIEILNYAKNKNDDNIDQLVKYGRLWADTEKLVMEVEYTEKEAEYSRDQYITYKTYTVENVDFGLVERPRQELTVVKDVENVRIISNTGQTIFDANEQTANLAWLKPTKSTTGNYYSRIDENGFITATVDENLMHGSTVKILYKIIIENTGEKDYVDSNGNVDQIFYKTGNPHGNIVTNRVTNIVDYVENNLKFNTDATEDDKFDAVDTGQTYNEDWERVKGEDNAGNKVDNFSEIEYLIHPDVLSDVREYNTIIKPKEESTLYIELEPAEKRVVHSEGDISKLVDIEGNFSGTDTSTYGQYVTTKLFLTKVLDTSDSNDDQFVYVNSLEILSSRNQAGRRSYNNFDKAQYEDNDQITDDNMKFTIPGNYNPKDAANSGNDNIPLEADYDFSESLTVLVPFGRKNIVIIIVSILVAVIVLGVGIVIIKKKVLKKDKQ